MFQNLQQVLLKFKNPDSFTAVLDIKNDFITLYLQNPNQIFEVIKNNLIDSSLEKRQLGITLLNQISKHPYYLSDVDETIIERCINDLSFYIYENPEEICFLRAKAVGIMYSRHCTQQQLQKISGLITSQTENILPWLKCLTEIMMRLRTCSIQILSDFFQIFNSILVKRRNYHKSEVTQMYECFGYFVKCYKRIQTVSYKDIYLEGFLQLLVRLIDKLGFEDETPVCRILIDICDSRNPHSNIHLTNLLYKYTQHYLSTSVEMVNAWSDVIQGINMELLSTSIENLQNIKKTLTNLANNAIKNIQQLDLWFNKQSQQNTYKPELAYASANVIISIYQKIQIPQIPIIVRKKTQKDYNPKNILSYYLLKSVYYCSPSVNSYSQSESKVLMEEIWECYAKQFIVIISYGQQSFDKRNAQLVKIILFGLYHLFSQNSDILSKYLITFFGKVCEFIFKVVSFSGLDEQTLIFARSVLEIVLERGKKHCIQLSSFPKINDIVQKYVLSAVITEGEKHIKDIVVNYVVDVMRTKISRSQKMSFLHKSQIACSTKQFGQAFVQDLCFFLSQIVEDIKGFDLSNTEEATAFGSIFIWVLNQSKLTNMPNFLIPFGSILKFNYEDCIKLLPHEFVPVLNKIAQEDPSLYFPVMLLHIKQNHDQSQNLIQKQLVVGLIQNLNFQSSSPSFLKRIFSTLKECFDLPFLQNYYQPLIQNMLVLLRNVPHKAMSDTQKLQLSCEILQMIMQLLSKTSEEVVSAIDLSLYLQYLSLTMPQLAHIAMSIASQEVNFRILLLQSVNIFISMLYKNHVSVNSLYQFSNKISQTLPFPVLMKVSDEVVNRLAKTMDMALQKTFSIRLR